MEVTAQSVSHATLTSCSTTCLTPSFLHSKSSLVVPNSIPYFQSNKGFFSHSQQIVKLKAKQLTSLAAVHAIGADQIPSTDSAERWLLVPVGDGDSRHIGSKVEMPGAFEIASNEVTVGRAPDKADVVIPVATVSGEHARIQKKGGNLLVTDLDSTNGTFIDEKRLRPGVAAIVSSGSRIIFGDIHLAMFRVSKLENVEAAEKPEESTDGNPTEA